MPDLFPFLSEYDPATTSEGSLDPLGLYPVADRLAVHLIPGFRERMGHPRFLTAMAVGSVICSGFDDDIVASDGVSEPWQVFEWYVVQALTRRFYKEPDEIRGLPGREKATAAYKLGMPLNATRYLKTASVFGFNGVYRTLARELNLLDVHDNLGEFGHELIQVWEKEQKLEGFYSTSTGPGRQFRNILYKAVKEGLEKGEVARKWGWGFFNNIAEYLAPYRMGKKEIDTIFHALINESAPKRGEVIQFLMSEKVQKIWKAEQSEKILHEELYNHASEELKELLLAIQHYEMFSRILQNAFESILYYLSNISRGNINNLAELEQVQRASKEIDRAYELALTHLEPFDESSGFILSFGNIANSGDSRDWVSLLFEHHKTNQRRKPPAGKKPWYERIPENSFMIYSKYKLQKEPKYTDDYVNSYRTNSLMSFLSDLKMISNGSE